MTAISAGWRGTPALPAVAGGGMRVLGKWARCIHNPSLEHPQAGDVGAQSRGHAFTVSTQACW